MKEKEQYLKILSVAYYVVGALSGLVAFFPILHLVVGVGLLAAGATGEPGDDAFPVMLTGGLFTVVAGGMIVLGLAYAIALIVLGRFLARRTHYSFCLVMGGVSCMFAPFGTVLGVLTLILLLSPDVKTLFDTDRYV